VKYLNNSRNFANDISNKESFLSLKEEISKKIKETLFDDDSFFSSSSFDIYSNNDTFDYLFEEGKNLSDLIDIKPLVNEEMIQEYLNSSSEGHPPDDDGESKKKLSESEDEKSSSFGSGQTKFSQIEEKKPKLNICTIKYPELLNLLNSNTNGGKENKKQDIYTNDKMSINIKINEIKKEIKKNENVNIKKNYLRRMVCLKLYKAMQFALKNFNLDNNEIKVICLYLEIQGRILDNSMGDKYKEYIKYIFKKISTDNSPINKNE